MEAVHLKPRNIFLQNTSALPAFKDNNCSLVEDHKHAIPVKNNTLASSRTV